MTWDDVRRIGLGFDGTEESTSYGTPALKVAHKMFVRLHQNGEYLVVRMPKPVRAVWLREKPDAFLVTEHYEGFPYVLVRLDTVTRADLKSVLEIGWGEG